MPVRAYTIPALLLGEVPTPRSMPILDNLSIRKVIKSRIAARPDVPTQVTQFNIISGQLLGRFQFTRRRNFATDLPDQSELELYSLEEVVPNG